MGKLLDALGEVGVTDNTVIVLVGRPLSTANASVPFSHIQAIPGGGDAERESTSNYPSYFGPNQLYDLPQDSSE